MCVFLYFVVMDNKVREEEGLKTLQRYNTTTSCLILDHTYKTDFPIGNSLLYMNEAAAIEAIQQL